MGNLQGIPAIKCEDRMKSMRNGNIDNSLSYRCEGLNPQNVYKTLYPQDADPLSQYKNQEGKLINGDPINPQPIAATSAADCAKTCDQNLSKGCQAFEYYSGDQTCNLYDKTGLTDGSIAETYVRNRDSDQYRAGVPEWMSSYYQNYPKNGKLGDYQCKYSAIDQSCTQVKQISCPKPSRGRDIPGDTPINAGGGDTFEVGRGGYSKDAKIRVNHIGFNQCQVSGDNSNCLHDIYTVNAFGFPTNHGSPNPPLNTLLYAKPYNVLYGKFAVACPSDTTFGNNGSNIGCFGSGETGGCMPTFYPFQGGGGNAAVSTQCNAGLNDEMYITNHRVDPSFEAGEKECAQKCASYGDTCTGYATYNQNGKGRCLLYKQSPAVLNANMYAPDGSSGLKSMIKRRSPYPKKLKPNTQPVKTEYESLAAPLLFCPSYPGVDQKVQGPDKYGNVYCPLGDEKCRSNYDPYSKKPKMATPQNVCQSYTQKEYKQFFASEKGEFQVRDENACKSVCDYDPKCTGYSVRKVGGKHYCTPYSVPVDKMNNFMIPSGVVENSTTKFKTVGGCPGSMVRDRGGNCVMKFNNRLLGETSTPYMAGKVFGGGIKRDPEPNSNSGTALMGFQV